MSDDLNKSLYRAVMKALGSKQDKAHAAQHVVKDVLDDNMAAEVPKNHLPAPKQNVLHKDDSISEMHDQKQAQAEAKLGMPPTKGPHQLRKFMEKCSMKKAQKGPAARAKEAKELKGVHTSGGFSGLESEGRSQAGNEITSRAPKAGNKYLKEMHHERGKEMHREKLEELKAMPKPKLPK